MADGPDMEARDADGGGALTPAEPANDELLVAAQPGGILVDGDPAAVALYIDRIQQSTGHAIQVLDIDKGSINSAAGLAAGAASVLSQSAKFVQLHPESVAAIQRGNLINGTDGFYRMMTRGADMKFTKQLQWKPANLSPQRMMSMQMLAVQVALKSAISEVEAAVERVEGKVDDVLRLAQATRSGDILGDRTSVERMVAYLEKHGSFSDTDWEWISGIGPGLNRTVEQLRQHALGTLKSFDPSRPIQDRADFVVNAVENQQLGETLSLLVVAEETLFKWQRLRIARVASVEPDHLQKVLDDAQELLAHQLSADSDVYKRGQEVLNAVSKTEAIDGLRFFSVQELNRDLPKLREHLDEFAKARKAQVLEWSNFEAPTPLQAVQAAADIATEKATIAISAATEGYTRVSDFLSKSTRSRAGMFARRKPKNDDAQASDDNSDSQGD